MTYHTKTTEAATGKWRGILLTLGVPEKALSGKHGPCPMCGGSDRFRFDDQAGRGTYICGQCGAGTGMQLAEKYTGLPFKEVADKIDAIVGNITPDTIKQPLSPEKRRDVLRNTYRATQPIQPGDLAHRYLESRGIEELVYPGALRFAPQIRDGDGGIRPALIAMIGVYGQPKFVSMHRTFLARDGSAKAEMAAPRKMMPGELPEGACVMLSDFYGGALGIAEGIETAMSASALYDMPVWAAINSTLLARWTPPDGCDQVVVFGDNDPKFGGQAAAYQLAHRLAVKGLSVSVMIPDVPGADFNDILRMKR